jgi:hypothetical protein
MIAIEKNTGRPTSRVDSRPCPTHAGDPRIDVPLLEEPERVLGDDDAGVDEDADRDGDAGEAHDVGRDAGVVHPEERAETASGSGIVTIRIDRKCIRKTTWASVTRAISSISARPQRVEACSIRSDRS